MRHPVLAPLSKVFRHLVLLGLALLWVGCAHIDREQLYPMRDKPAFRYDETGIPHAFKRTERYAQRDFFHHCFRKAYFKPSRAPLTGLDTDEARTLAEWGLPNWMRKPYRSLTGEWVHEWVYTDQHHLFQFVKGKTVFDGPLTDFEQILMMRGYPDTAEVTRNIPGSSIVTFVYFGYFWPPWMEEFHFVNDTLIQGQEGF